MTENTTATAFARTDRPTDSPWGHVDQAEEYAPGIWTVATASHGGAILSRERYAALPTALRCNVYGRGTAFDEDLEALIPLLYWRDEIDAFLAAKGEKPLRFDDEQVRACVQGLKRYANYAQAGLFLEARLGKDAS